MQLIATLTCIVACLALVIAERTHHRARFVAKPIASAAFIVAGLHAPPWIVAGLVLGALFRDIGQVDVPMFAMPAPKQRYIALEMQRWARWWGVPFDMPRKFPQRTVNAQRLCVLAAEQSAAAGLGLAIALGRAMWAEQRDLEDADTLRAILADTGLPPAWLERCTDPAVKEKLATETAAAKAAGVFGVPTFIVNGTHLYWGQDRLDLVADALR